MGINSNTYNTFSDDIEAHKVAIQIERNLMGLKQKRKRKKVKGKSSFTGNSGSNVGSNPNNEAPIDKTFKKEEDKRDTKITSLQSELEKMKTQNTRAVESSNKNTGSFWQRNKKDVMDAVIVLGILYIGYKMFFDKKEVTQNAMGGEESGVETGGEVAV